MKKFALFILATLLTVTGSPLIKAQSKYGADSAQCLIYLSYYSEYYKQKNYDQAIPNWRKAYQICPPTARQNMLIEGATMVRELIKKNSSNAEYKKALIDTLLTLHETRAEYYPKYAVSSLNIKGQDITNYLRGNDKAIYEGLSDIIARNGNDTKPSLLLFDLDAAIKLYKAGNLDAEKVIETYQTNMAIIEKAPAKSEAEANVNAKVKSDMEGLFITSKVASCDNLVELFTPRFKANPDDIDLVTNIVKMMSSTDECTGNELYLEAVTAMHKLQPSSQSAYFLYRLNSSSARNNVEEAIKYLEEAISYPDLEASTAADYNYRLADYCIKNNQFMKAYNAASKAAELDKDYAGRSYWIMGLVWASQRCGGNEIESRAKYWVATDYMQKAMNADASLADDCRKMIASYSAYFPKTEDAFMYDIHPGNSYSVSCGGMRATTTVRTNK